MNLNTSFLLREAQHKMVESERLAAQAAALRSARLAQPSTRERVAQTLVEIAARLSPEAARAELGTRAGRTVYSRSPQEPKPYA